MMLLSNSRFDEYDPDARWMLREAVQSGLLLDPSGFSLQPALRLPAHANHADHDIDKETLAQLDTLAKMLMAQSKDAKLDLTNWHQLKAISSLITQEALFAIIKAVCKLDTDVSDALSPDAMRPLKESLTWAWWPVEFLLLSTRHYTDVGAHKNDRYK